MPAPTENLALLHVLTPIALIDSQGRLTFKALDFSSMLGSWMDAYLYHAGATGVLRHLG